MKKMRIRITRDGKTKILVEGGQGDDCLAFTRAVENALGEVENRARIGEQVDDLQVEIKADVAEREIERF